MIFIVDDEDTTLETLARALVSDGHEVRTFGGAAEALEALSGACPRLVISDVVMPDMGGFEFREEYVRRFPRRKTPFVFLSSMADPDVMVKGLDQGADDYLVKPLNNEVLKAKVRSLMQRAASAVPAASVFHGDLGKFPLPKIMQFCELKGFTGVVEVEHDGQRSRLGFKGGAPELGDEGADAEFERMYDLTEGVFSLLPGEVDFSELSDVAVIKASPLKADDEKPMGRLSGIEAGGRLFQVQTEFISKPDELLLSLVILDGKVVLKRSNPVAHSLDKAMLERMLGEQHQSVENEIKDKLVDAASKKAAKAESPAERFGQLLESGFEKYRERDYEAAMEIWGQAQSLNPSDKTLGINLAIVKKKLQR